MTTRREKLLGGFRAIGLVSERVEVWVVPELGARIASLRDRTTGREWCWRQPRARWLWPNRPGEAFTASPHAGIDECLPTIGLCTHTGRTLPDHGDVWSRAWMIEPLPTDAITCTVDVQEGGYRFRRRLSLHGTECRLDYRLENHGSAPLDFLWSLHPLLTINPGDEIELPPEVKRCEVEYPRQPESPRRAWTWPMTDGARLNRLELPAAVPGCAKLFTGPLRRGSAALANPGTGDRLEFSWDVSAQPWLGLWLTRGGYQGWHHVAIEPTNAPCDALGDALEAKTDARVVAPRGVCEWIVYLCLTGTASRSSPCPQSSIPPPSEP